MSPSAKKIIFGWGISAILFVAGCSPSSYSSRYNKPEDANTEEKNSSARFTSENDPKPTESAGEKRESYGNPGVRYSDEFDEEPVEDIKVDSKDFVDKYAKMKSYNIGLTPRERLLFEIIGYLDTPYQYGGNDYLGIDCSAFTQNVYNSSLDVSLPRTASEQYQSGETIDGSLNLNFGDLVFFNTTANKYPGHVGIYMGDDLFVHSSFTKGVIISSLNSSYYKERYVGARRVRNFAGN